MLYDVLIYKYKHSAGDLQLLPFGDKPEGQKKDPYSGSQYNCCRDRAVVREVGRECISVTDILQWICRCGIPVMRHFGAFGNDLISDYIVSSGRKGADEYMVVFPVMGRCPGHEPARQRAFLFVDFYLRKPSRVYQDAAFSQFYITGLSFAYEFTGGVAVEGLRTIEIAGAKHMGISRYRGDFLFEKTGVPAAEGVPHGICIVRVEVGVEMVENNTRLFIL
jgi:hypothetical protein